MASREEVRRVSIFINGSEADMTLKNLEAGSRKLRNQLAQLIPGTEEFKRKMMELRQVNRVLQDVQNDIRGVGGAFGWLKTEIGKLGVLATGFLGFQFVTDQFRNIISQNAKLADSIADIQKTTGMSEAAVKRLQSSFKQIDTRSSRAELSSLAEVAGKLGITGEENVLGFVKAADQINVALGKDLGNAEGAINDLGKLTEIFKIKDAYGLEQALLKTGSAINDLGAAGTANEGYIVEFTKRLGGIAPQAKISIQDILGLAATMDELGQPAEAASTAISQFVMGLGKDIPKFAKVAGLSVAEFSKLLATDGNQALIAVLKNLKSSGEGIGAMAESMGMIGEEGARATAALGLLTNNLELLQERQKMAKSSFDEGISLTNEYNVKNNNFAATLEKLGKKFNALTSNSNLTTFLIALVKATSAFIDGLNKAMGFISAVTKLVIVGAVAYGAYNAVLGITILLQKDWIATLKATEAYTKLVTLATAAQKVVVALMRGEWALAKTEMAAFNVVAGANPIGLIVASIAAVITALVLFKSEVNNAVKVQEMMNKVHQEGADKIIDEKTKVEQLQAILKSETATRYEKLQAVARLREIMPEHLKSYSDEQVLALKATDAIAGYIRQLERRANAEAAFEQMKELQKQRQTVMREGKDLNVAQWVGVIARDITFQDGQGYLDRTKNFNKEEALQLIDQQMEALKANFGEDIKKNLITDTENGGSAGFDLKNSTKDQLEEQLAKDTKAIAQLKRGTEEYNKVATEMVAIRKRLKEISIDTGIGGGGKEEDPVKKAKRQFNQLQKEVKELYGKSSEEAMAANSREIKAASDKYQKLIDKEKAFLLQKGVSKAQAATTNENIEKLEADQAQAVNNIIFRQEKELTDKVLALRRSLANAHETELQKESVRINAFYDEQQENALDLEEWMYLEENRAKEIADAKIREEKRLQDTIEELKQQGVVSASDKDKIELARINKKYDDQIDALKRNFEKRKDLEEKFQEALGVIEKNRKNETAQYEKEKDKEVKQAIEQAAYETTRAISDAFFEVGANNRRAETDAQLASLDKRKEKELQNKNLTEAQKQAIEDKYDKQAAQIKLKAWKADQAAKRTQAIINGALAVTMALASSPWPFNLINAAAVAAATAVQVVKIGKEKPPQYEDGGYSSVDYKKPQGWVRSPTLFKNSASGREYTAGEKFKTEYIVSSEQLKDPVISDFVGAMEANRGVRRFEAGGFSNAVKKVQQPVTVQTPAAPAPPPVDLSPLVDEMRMTRHAVANMKLTFSNRIFKKNEEKMQEILDNVNA
ncbi:phage tail tape measure protein [Mucilaginibacter sp. Bleaf8]|uniref:phage tail tape measure protein n=1 Tax=Mucilaginibacter sp. Bleaf8 TaxID=2834430 RepID=UPI001BD19395|nr:phage tail tape measure protein [Mucilaginibacter sp. Bleaf8]MBS7565068.1 phage tail tape measure protein [Mucilaginibacter sp. Bleaf8]